MGAPGNKDGQDDLAILHPEREQVIAGEKIVMREYGFVEGLRMQPLAQPIIDALGESALRRERLDIAAAAVIFAAHDDTVITLIARACDRDEAWVRGLSDADGQTLLALWWSVNVYFFVRRVGEAMTRRVLDATSADGPTSTPPSSPTGTPATSASSPSVN